MTFRTSINSKGTPRDLLKRGFKSMFANYDKTNDSQKQAGQPPVDTESDQPNSTVK